MAWDLCGIVRSGEAECRARSLSAQASKPFSNATLAMNELRNLHTWPLLSAAARWLARKAGAHYRVDFPPRARNPENIRCFERHEVTSQACGACTRGAASRLISTPASGALRFVMPRRRRDEFDAHARVRRHAGVSAAVSGGPAIATAGPWSVLWTAPSILVAASLSLAASPRNSHSRRIRLDSRLAADPAEFAVEAVLAKNQQVSLLFWSNLTGALRLLIGLGWPMIYATRRRSRIAGATAARCARSALATTLVEEVGLLFLHGLLIRSGGSVL